MTKRIMMRAGKSPFDVVSPEETYKRRVLGGNLGNLLFTHAAHRALETDDADVVAGGLAWRSHHASRINADFDAFVVPLANAFRLGFEKELVHLTKLISKLTAPVVVLGVGAQATRDYDTSRLQPIEASVKAFVGAVLDRSATIGVRGELTFDYLTGLGFKDVEVIGCPSLFLNGDRLHVQRKAPELEANAKVAINISPYRKRMGKVLSRHLERYPNLTYVAQDRATLRRLLHGDRLYERREADQNDVPVHTSHPIFRAGKVRTFVDAGPWLDYLATRDFCFGTRIHGNMAATVAGTPSFV
ncbi:MAG: polysaccharide pyruvyl transferase family protein, partial [Acidimicrobiia bacterium]